MKIHRVTLSAEERAELKRMTRTGKAAATKLAHTRILLLADERQGSPARSDGQIINSPPPMLGSNSNGYTLRHPRFNLIP